MNVTAILIGLGPLLGWGLYPTIASKIGGRPVNQILGSTLGTLIFALIDSPVASDLLKASIAATIFVPVILYGLLMVTRLLKDDSKDNS